MSKTLVNTGVKRVKKAVLPVAGLGTRFLPATKAVPKEMLPIIDVPMIQYIVEEAVNSGIEDVVLVTARHKEAIENHFDLNYELEETLLKKHNTVLADLSKAISKLCNLISIRQKMPLGLGHAVACAEPIIGNEPFAVLLGDEIFDSNVPCIKQLINIYEENDSSVIGVMNVLKEDVSKYGIVFGSKINDRLTKVTKLVEKPDFASAPSTLAIPGRYVLSPTIFKYLREIKPGKGGEFQLTDALSLMADRENLLAYLFEGKRYDTGDKIGYISATIAFALKRPELKEGVKKLLKDFVEEMK